MLAGFHPPGGVSVSRARSALAIVAFAAILTSACDTAHTVAPPAPGAPEATTPQAAVGVLEWGFNHRNVDAIAGLLPQDFSFVSLEIDSAGNVEEEVWTREQLIATLNGMFDGDRRAPAARRVQLDFDPNLTAFSDDRPGRNPAFHHQVRTSIDLKVEVEQGETYQVTGHLLCSVTRGDSAMIPIVESARGAHPDSSRWWIDRIEDETRGEGTHPELHTTPALIKTLADLLSLWHHGPTYP
jgi:hypothetical protein